MLLSLGTLRTGAGEGGDSSSFNVMKFFAYLGMVLGTVSLLTCSFMLAMKVEKLLKATVISLVSRFESLLWTFLMLTEFLENLAKACTSF